MSTYTRANELVHQLYGLTTPNELQPNIVVAKSFDKIFMLDGAIARKVMKHSDAIIIEPKLDNQCYPSAVKDCLCIMRSMAAGRVGKYKTDTDVIEFPARLAAADWCFCNLVNHSITYVGLIREDIRELVRIVRSITSNDFIKYSPAARIDILARISMYKGTNAIVPPLYTRNFIVERPMNNSMLQYIIGNDSDTIAIRSTSITIRASINSQDILEMLRAAWEEYSRQLLCIDPYMFRDPNFGPECRRVVNNICTPNEIKINDKCDVADILEKGLWAAFI